jgi:cytidyltransferase-like protein
MRLPLGCVTGRFQPVHRQHLELFGLALERCDRLVVAVTNPDPGARRPEAASSHRHTTEANPFTYYERVCLLGAALAEAGWARRTVTVPFDLTRPEHWAHYVPSGAHQFVRAYSEWEREKAARLTGAGYPVSLLEGDPDAKLSAGDVRQSLTAGDGAWEQWVPAATVPLLRALLAGRAGA